MIYIIRIYISTSIKSNYIVLKNLKHLMYENLFHVSYKVLSDKPKKFQQTYTRKSSTAIRFTMLSATSLPHFRTFTQIYRVIELAKIFSSSYSFVDFFLLVS